MSMSRRMTLCRRPLLNQHERILDVLVRGEHRNQVEVLKHEADVLSPQVGGRSCAESRYVPIEYF